MTHPFPKRRSSDLARAQPVRDLACKAERSLEVQVHHRIEQVFGHLVAGAGRRHAGVVDKDVDAAELGIGGGDQAVDLVPAPAMAAMRQRAPSRCAARSEERREGTEGVSTGRTRWWPYH